MIKAARLNARVPEPLAERVAELARRSERSVSEVVVSALESYCGESARPYASLEGLIGIGNGPADLSTNYKRYLTSDLEQKYAPSVREKRAAKRR